MTLVLLRSAIPRIRRAWRRHRPGNPDARVVSAWHDVLDAGTSPPGMSRAAITLALLRDHLSGRLAAAEPAGRTLARLADRALYSRYSCTAEEARTAWHAAGQVHRALRHR